MPQVSVTINGRRFRMACENGEEPLSGFPSPGSSNVEETNNGIALECRKSPFMAQSKLRQFKKSSCAAALRRKNGTLSEGPLRAPNAIAPLVSMLLSRSKTFHASSRARLSGFRSTSFQSRWVSGQAINPNLCKRPSPPVSLVLTRFTYSAIRAG